MGHQTRAPGDRLPAWVDADPAEATGSQAGCCPAGGAAVALAPPPLSPARDPADDGLAHDVTAYVRPDGDGSALSLMVEGIHCGGCVAKIERALAEQPDVRRGRVNMTTRRLALAWDGPPSRGGDLAALVGRLGYRVAPFDPDQLASADQAEERRLLRAMAVAGFASGNVMLLSVSVWAGHFQGMADTTRDLLHWFSALIALPALLYAGQPFFRSAGAVLRRGHTNMDVPITLAVVLASAMSLHETMTSGPHAYFDSAIMLVFFLLVGRYLDRRARGRARSAAERLLALRATAVTVVDADGTRRHLPADQVTPGSTVLVAAGERIGVDGRVLTGRSDVDTSLLTGESVPRPAGPGDRVFAGAINQSAPLTLTAQATGEDTLLSEIVRLMESAEQNKARFVGLADRISRAYAPAVHLLAAVTFLGWWLWGGADWQVALLIAVAVLIITCPCALGLAVPAVQVIASGRLMRHGTLLKSATALERLAKIDTVVFDKTGTLTLGRPDWIPDPGIDGSTLALAAGMAGASRHPLARALCRAAPDVPVLAAVVEVPGRGLSLDTPDGPVRLGSRAWCGVPVDDRQAGPELWLIRPGHDPVRFGFVDTVRADAADTIAALKARGLAVELLSGDRAPTVAAVAGQLGIADHAAEVTPDGKVARLTALTEAGRTVLMVGDGLNDAPALAAATVSVSPASAADISQTAADAVFQGDRLHPVVDLLDTARKVDRLVKQNFVLALGYNLFTIPIAMAGFVTPLIAAVAMSSSSLVVVGNAMRLAGWRRPG